MDDPKWRKMWDVFDHALEKAPAERAAYLAASCAADKFLRAEVEALLKSHKQGENVLDSPGLLHPLLEVADWTDDLIGTRIGSYRIQKIIGEGGMGIVYAADQEEPLRRRVALKLIKLGMDTREVIARFESERQALALMNHPHIAAVHEAGVTEAGRPYFVMELVEGVPIINYCDQRQLTIRQRLELFVTVCQAVQHAHQKGIIHRDLKPSNILVADVGDTPLPKIIDFGIAKAIHRPLADGTLRTVLDEMIGTPEFMSPEQSEAAVDIDTRTDIYSLGILLYILLTGALPFRIENPRPEHYNEIKRMIRESEFPSPSARVNMPGHEWKTIAERRKTDLGSLRRQLRGEIDWIVLKAMEKDRTRRYDTASEFAADIERFLRHQPLLAGPPVRTYRARKFVQRHRLGVALAASFLVVLIGFGAVMTVQSARISRALEETQKQRTRAEKVSAFLVELFKLSDPYVPREHPVTAREILDKGAERISEELKYQPEVQAELLDTMGTAYRGLAIYDKSASLLQEALRLRKKVYGEEHPEVATSLNNLGALSLYKGDRESAEKYLREALSMRRKLLGDEHAQVVETLVYLGSTLREKGDYAAAEPLLHQALSLRRKLPLDPVMEANIVDQLAAVLHRKGEYDTARLFYQEALELRRKLPAAYAPSTSDTLNNFGAFLLDRGDYAAAEPLLREALQLRQKRLGEEHPRVLGVQNNLALLFYERGDLAAAETIYRKSLALARRIWGNEHAQVAILLNNLALVLLDQGDYLSAERLFREVVELQRKAWGPRHPNVAFGLNNLARTLHARQDYAAADKLYREALELRRATLPPKHPDIAASLTWLGKLRMDRGDPQVGELLLRDALEIRKQSLSPGDWRIAETQTFLGSCLAARKNYAEAEPLLVNSYAKFLKARGPKDRKTLDALRRLVQFYGAWHRPDKAKEYQALLGEAGAQPKGN